ncbi:MAG: tagaturonate epimerase family protein, partial [Planctomycetota bacterium]
MPDAGALLEALSGGASLGESDAGTVAKAIAESLGPAAAACIYPGSLAGSGGEVYAAAKGKGSERLVLAASRGPTGGRAEAKLGRFALALSPWNDRSAKELRSKLAHLAPGPLGRGTSAGLGDRLGSATVGHARAVRGTLITPVFAQQSIREMTRTGRSPDDVMLDATWGV